MSLILKARHAIQFAWDSIYRSGEDWKKWLEHKVLHSPKDCHKPVVAVIPSQSLFNLVFGPVSRRFIVQCLVNSIVPVVFLVVQYSPFNLDGGLPMISSNAVPSCMGLFSLFSGLGLDV